MNCKDGNNVTPDLQTLGWNAFAHRNAEPGLSRDLMTEHAPSYISRLQ